MAFEKGFWKLEPKLSEENKELAATATLRSIALNYVKQKRPIPPKSMLRAIGQLKKNEDIIITRPDKGSGVVVMDKSESDVRLQKEASINDETKFVHVSLEDQMPGVDLLSITIRCFKKRRNWLPL